MGNLVFVPGSHRQQYLPAYSTHEAADGEKQLLVRRGTITIMNTALWHRTAPNRSDTTRINLYLGYSPSWLPTSDRNTSDPVWLASLNREQRIIETIISGCSRKGCGARACRNDGLMAATRCL